MLEARVSPITSVLTDDPKTILRATGILSRLWRLTLGELKLDYVKWINNADDYIARCKKEYKDVDLSNTKGNLGKALARDEVTWDVFCKGLSLLKLKNPRLSLLLKHGDIGKTIVIDIPFTCNEDRGVLLSKAWKKVKKEFPDKVEDWDKLIGEYGKKQNIPVIIDYRDMWPEVFVDILPKKIRLFGRIALFQLFSKTRNVFKKADGLIGIT